MEDLRRFSSSSSPICFKCDDKGYLANTYHNGTLFFACNGIGHKSFRCPDWKIYKPKAPQAQPPLPPKPRSEPASFIS
jgi:hypothetical protein